MRMINAFFMGARQFRQSFTNRYDDLVLCDAYDLGRELAHKITLRKFETN